MAKGNLTPTPAPLIAEGFINFSREVSIIATRAQDGSIRTYDLVENNHHTGILATSHAPAVGTSHLLPEAKKAIEILMTHLDYVGTMALELFVSKDEKGKDVILANEIAPRVHNSQDIGVLRVRLPVSLKTIYVLWSVCPLVIPIMFTLQ